MSSAPGWITATFNDTCNKLPTCLQEPAQVLGKAAGSGAIAWGMARYVLTVINPTLAAGTAAGIVLLQATCEADLDKLGRFKELVQRVIVTTVIFFSAVSIAGVAGYTIPVVAAGKVVGAAEVAKFAFEHLGLL